MKECPQCRKTFDDGVNFCPFDGSSLKAVEEGQKGKVKINVDPPKARILIDGLPRGTGPSLSLELPPGQHRLEALAEGYGKQKMTFSLSDTQELILTLELQAGSSPGNANAATSPDSRVQQPEMVQIKGGFYMLGNERGNPDERPLRKVKVTDFWIDRVEVTCSQYQAFLEAIRKSGHKWCHPLEAPNKDHTPFHTYAWALRFSWVGGKPPSGMENHPVVLVDWFDAWAFAKWAGKRLPSEDEWEISAGGGDGREYPWGNTFYTDHCNVGQYPVRVGAFPEGKSPWGILDLAGNVGEWTATAYETDARDGKNFDGRFGQPIIRGGSWDDESRGCRISARDVHRTPTYRSTTVGFRCASDLPPEQLTPGN